VQRVTQKEKKITEKMKTIGQPSIDHFNRYIDLSQGEMSGILNSNKKFVLKCVM